MKKRMDEEQEEMPRWDLEDLSQTVATLKRGGLILYPTDTIWGIGCDATNADAVSRIFALKQRDDAKALLSIVSSDGMLAQVVRTIPDIAYDMMDTATKPLTIIYPNAVGLAPNLLAEDGSAGIRVVGDPFCKKMCERLGGPIVSTSANISGEPSPAAFADITDEVRNGVDYVVRYRQEEQTKHIASNIIKLGLRGEVKVIR